MNCETSRKYGRIWSYFLLEFKVCVMLTVLCIMILAWWIMGKDIKPLLEKVKDVDWRGKVRSLMDRIRPYALKLGRAGARPLLQCYYVLSDDKTTIRPGIKSRYTILYAVFCRQQYTVFSEFLMRVVRLCWYTRRSRTK